ncbi:MAG: NAD(P)-dependent oxidoreductase [Candidatus Aenigmarchaeota archaeon]|nr:NAD(P)-dependent oxidoreductase [Candidatus Aenigmarchaeota archaeon]
MKLVTGGSGFFGSFLVEELLKKDDVRVLDIKEPKAGDAEFVKGDVRAVDDVKKALKGCDTVFHLASLLPQSGASGKDVRDVIVAGSGNVFSCALGAGTKVVHVSSSSVFGQPKKVPYAEDDPKAPLGMYGKSKLEAEELMLQYHAKGLDVVGLRPMTMVGPGIYGIFDMCLRWIKKGRPIPILGSGKNRMQMISVHDMADACMKAEKCKAAGEIMNIGSDNVPELREMFEAVFSMTGSKSRLITLNTTLFRNIFRAGHFLHVSPLTPEHYLLMDKTFILDNSKAKRLLKWKPEYGNVDMIIDAYKGIK